MGHLISGPTLRSSQTSSTNMASQTYTSICYVALINEAAKTAIKIGKVNPGQRYSSIGFTVLTAPTEAELDTILANQNITIIK